MKNGGYRCLCSEPLRDGIGIDAAGKHRRIGRQSRVQAMSNLMSRNCRMRWRNRARSARLNGMAEDKLEDAL